MWKRAGSIVLRVSIFAMENTQAYKHKNNLKYTFPLLKRLVVFALVFVFAMALALLLTGYICREGRLGTTYQKNVRLVTATSPKLVMIGGSNLHYGINSRMLQDSIGLQVVNMGLQHSIGLQYMFDEVRESLYKNDVLLLLLEPSAYIGMPVNGRTNIARIASIYPKNIDKLNATQWYNAAMYSGLALLQNYRDSQVVISKKLRGKPTFDQMCDELGDYHGHKGLPSKYKKKQRRDFNDEKIFNNEILPLIQEMKIYTQSNDIQMVIGFSPSAYSASDSLLFTRIQAGLPAEITVGNMPDYIFPDSFFYDSPNHLIYSKRDMRTRKLLRDLRRASIFFTPH